MRSRSQYPVVLSARVGSAALTAISLALVGRASGPADFGRFAALLAVVSVVTTLSDRGHQTLAVRMYARQQERPRALAVMAIQRRLTLVVTMAQCGILALLAIAGYLPAWGVALAVWQWFEKEIRGALGIALADGRVVVQLVSLILNRTVALIGFLVLLNWAPAVLAFVISSACAAGLSLLILYRRTPSYSTEGGRSLDGGLRRQARHFWLASMSAQIRSLDVALISIAATPFQAGLYSLPSRVSNPLKIAATSMSTVALPVASRGDRGELAELRRTMRWITAASCVGLGLLGVFAEPLILATVGGEFVGSVTPLRILLVGLALNIPGSFVSGVLQGSGHERRIARLGMLLSAATVTFVPGGAYLAGAAGAAVAITGVYFVQFVAVNVMARNER